MESIETIPEKEEGKSRVKAKYNQGGRFITLLLFLLPTLCLFTLFVVVPLIEASVYSGYRWNGIGELNNFVGAQNYQRMSSHAPFQIAVSNTLKIVAVSLLVQLPLAMAVAMCVYKKSWGNTVFRMLFFPGQDHERFSSKMISLTISFTCDLILPFSGAPHEYRCLFKVLRKNQRPTSISQNILSIV